jgi:hypothetical protein
MHNAGRLPKALIHSRPRAKSKSRHENLSAFLFYPLYPFIVSLNDFLELKLAIHSKRRKRKEPNKTIVNIEGISDCSPQLKIAKNAFLDFQSSALPTELPSQPFINKLLRLILRNRFDRGLLFVLL